MKLARQIKDVCLKEKKSNILTFQKRTCLGEKKRKKAEEKQKARMQSLSKILPLFFVKLVKTSNRSDYHLFSKR